MLIKIAVTLILMAIFVFLIIILQNKKENTNSDSTFDPEKSEKNCPICGCPLKRGETVHSHLYPGKPDGMMYIYGCPFCYKNHPHLIELKNVKRICPYCKTSIPQNGWVIARVFEKPGKTHVHVLGCTECRKVT